MYKMACQNSTLMDSVCHECVANKIQPVENKIQPAPRYKYRLYTEKVKHLKKRAASSLKTDKPVHFYRFLDEHVQNKNSDPKYLNGIFSPKYWLTSPAHFNWEYFSAHPGITLTDIQLNYDLIWDGEYIFYNPNLTYENLMSFVASGVKFNFYAFSCNPNVNINIVLKHRNENWNWTALSMNLGISFRDITENADLPWDWAAVSWTVDLDIEFVAKNMHLPWCWTSISANPAADPSHYKKYPHFPWDWVHGFSQNPNFDTDVFYNAGREPNWYLHTEALIQRAEIKFIGHYYGIILKKDANPGTKQDSNSEANAIQEYLKVWERFAAKPHLPWNWSYISEFAPLIFILQNPNLPWDFNTMSLNINLTIDFDRKNATLLNWYRLSYNPAFKMRDIIHNFDLPWVLNAILGNPHIDINFIRYHLQRITDWSELYSNYFLYDEDNYRYIENKSR